MTDNLSSIPSYFDDDALLTRQQTHEKYTLPTLDFPGWVVELHPWRGNEQVLDVGSGQANYLPALLDYIPAHQYIGLDRSLRFLKNAHQQGAANLIAADATALPFPDASFDVVLANHLLYHLNDLDGAVEEFRRVLRPDGVLIAATSSQFTMPEFNTLIQRAFRLLGRVLEEDENPEQQFVQRFSLETGTYRLARHFQAVARYDIPSSFVFLEADPVIRYINTLRPFYEAYMPDGIAWDDFITVMSDQVRRLVNHFGELVVNKLSGVIIATDNGGFASEYQRRLNGR